VLPLLTTTTTTTSILLPLLRRPPPPPPLLPGNHLNLSTKLLKKIHRYHHKENLIALITQQYSFEYWKKNNGEEWQKCSSIILDPTMENQW
jgi:hypothetical protein